jgi:hypothetical protein
MNSGNFVSAKNAEYLTRSGLKNLIYQGGMRPLSSSFISLNQNYEYVTQISHDYFLYKKREKRLSVNSVCTDKVGIKWAENYNAPALEADFTLIKVFFERTYLDRLLSIVFKPIPVFFNKSTVIAGEEVWERFAIEDELAAKGFLLTASKSDLAEMPSNDANHLATASSFSLTAGRKNSEFQWLWNLGLFVRPSPSVQFCKLNFFE